MKRHISCFHARAIGRIGPACLFALLVTGFAAAGSGVEGVRDQILEWAESVGTFHCTYEIEQVRLHGGTRNVSLHRRIEYLRQEDNFFFRLEFFDPGMEFQRAEVLAQYGDEGQALYEEAAREHTYGVVQLDKRNDLGFPWGVYLTPEEILGAYHGDTLRQILSEGDSRVIEQPETRVFSHDNWSMHRFVDLHLDPEGRVAGIDWVLRRPPAEFMLGDIQEPDPLSDRLIRITLELQDYMTFDHIEFPTRVVKTWWSLPEAESRALVASNDSGQIDDDEYWWRICQIPPVPDTVQVFTLTSARFNLPLAEEDFRIDWPPGAPLYASQGPGAPARLVSDPHAGSSRLVMIFLALAAMMLLLFGGLGLIRRFHWPS